MKDYPRLFPIWFLPLVLLVIIIVGPCGCKTGGSWIGSGSAGTIITPQTPQQINEQNRPRLEPLAQAKLPSARTTPSTTETMKSVEANSIHVDPKPAGALESFSPTVSDTPKNIKLSTAKVEPLPTKLIEGDGGCVIITDERVNPRPLPKAPENPNNQAPAEVEEKAAMEVDWVRLVMFYFIAFLIIALAWVSWDIFKSYRKNSPTKQTTRKKTTKKKTAKKAKSPRKASKG